MDFGYTTTDDLFVFSERSDSSHLCEWSYTPPETATSAPALLAEPVDVTAMLRPYQTELIELLRASIRKGNKRVMAMAPTGFGKTIVAVAMMQKAEGQGKRVIFTAPYIDLVTQTADKLIELGIYNFGVIQADHPLTDPSQPIQICSVDSLKNRAIPPADLVIVDEAHLWREFFSSWMGDPEWADVPFIGLSATPGTVGPGRYYTDLVSVVTTQGLIDKGLLSPFRVFAPGAPDLSKVKVVRSEHGPDYQINQLAEAMSPLTADIVTTWLRQGNNEPTLLFCVNRLHAQELQQAFLDAGIPTGYRDAFTTAEERKEQARQFKAGELKIMANVGTLTTGVDWDVRCLILARPTKSPALYTQIIGRALRTADGKLYATILDHTDTTKNLGFVTDITFSLDAGTKTKQKKAEKKEEKPALPTECPNCKVLRPPKQVICHACGFETKPQSKIVCEDGELVEITRTPKVLTKVATDPAIERQLRQKWWSMLGTVEETRGYKTGWRWHTFRQRFGTNPYGLDNTSREEPDPTLLNYLRHLNIKRSYGRKRAA